MLYYDVQEYGTVEYTKAFYILIYYCIFVCYSIQTLLICTLREQYCYVYGLLYSP